MANIFQIENKMLALLEDNIDIETGEIIEDEDTFLSLYDSIELELMTKIDNSCSLLKVVENENNLIDAEIKRLEALKDRNKNKTKWITNGLDIFFKKQFINDDGELNVDELKKYVKSIKLPHNSISYTTSESIEIDPTTDLPAEYIRIKIEQAPKKTELKKAIKSGEIIDGVKLNKNISIKIK